MLTFATAIFFLLVTPGPGVLSLAGVGSAFGWRPGWAYGIGLFFGSNAVMLVAAAGLAAALLAMPGLRVAFVVLSTGYLLYLAARIALAGSRIGFLEASAPPGVGGGLVLQAFNPKAYAVGTFVFSNFPFAMSYGWEVVWKMVILNAVWIPIHVAWLAAGVGLRSLDLAPGTQRAINVAMAVAMVIVVTLALRSSLSG